MSRYQGRYSSYYDREEKPVKTFNIERYIQKEFFEADDPTFNKIANLYRRLYGDGPYRYMLNTFYSWKSGHRNMSGQSMYKILECVPKFLTDEKKFYILKCEILFFLDTIHYKFRKKKLLFSELTPLFENYHKEISAFDQINLNWFVGKGIFSDAEIQEFLSVGKYAMSQKLNLCYRQVFNDIRLIKEKLSNLRTGMFEAKYEITFLNSTIDFSNINDTEDNQAKLPESKLTLQGKFKQFAEQYVMDEFLKMDYAESQGKANYFIKSKDLDFFVSQYNEIASKGQQVLLKSDFMGEGGIFFLELTAKSIKRIRGLVLISGLKLFLLLSALITSILLIFHYNLYENVMLIFWGGILLGGFLITSIVGEIKLLKKLNFDLKIYGKR